MDSEKPFKEWDMGLKNWAPQKTWVSGVVSKGKLPQWNVLPKSKKNLIILCEAYGQ
jgi:hypothetical protein